MVHRVLECHETEIDAQAMGGEPLRVGQEVDIRRQVASPSRDRAIRLDPGADLRIALRPGGRRGRSLTVHPEGKGATLLVRPPEEDECVPVLGDAEVAECRNIERAADVGTRSGSSDTRWQGPWRPARGRWPGRA